MFQRALILAAISAAFASEYVPTTSLCPNITGKLQEEFRKEDPYMFPIMSNFIYVRGTKSYTFDFSNLIFRGFSNVSCNSFKVTHHSKTHANNSVATLVVLFHNWEFLTNETDVADSKKERKFSMKLSGTLELRYATDDDQDSRRTCILPQSLELIFQPSQIVTNIVGDNKTDQELKNHPEAVAEAINLYIHRFADTLTTTLNNILCPISH
ncbi:uncharacterized protein [Palaemon carinicauda]|uniref:uncharacterized protein n=1 Tax=Palaemon carinicauda TaxID=392227 RepID=UPI0035B68316